MAFITIGPTIVSSIWSVGVFKEIQGKRNLILLIISLLCIIGSIILLCVSVFVGKFTKL